MSDWCRRQHMSHHQDFNSSNMIIFTKSCSTKSQFSYGCSRSWVLMCSVERRKRNKNDFIIVFFGWTVPLRMQVKIKAAVKFLSCITWYVTNTNWTPHPQFPKNTQIFFHTSGLDECNLMTAACFCSTHQNWNTGATLLQIKLCKTESLLIQDTPYSQK